MKVMNGGEEASSRYDNDINEGTSLAVCVCVCVSVI